MDAILAPITSWARDVVRGWDRFLFTPSPPHPLAAIRIFGGAMLLYTHAVWTINLDAFLGPHSWLTSETVSLMNRGPDDANYALSYLCWVRSPAGLWMLHFAALAVIAMLIVGLFTRVTSVLVWIITLSYCHRLTGTLFGLDQINAFVATYLMFGDSGGVWSLDRWLAARRGLESPVRSTVGTNIAIRLLQLHMCMIYLFGG